MVIFEFSYTVIVFSCRKKFIIQRVKRKSWSSYTVVFYKVLFLKSVLYQLQTNFYREREVKLESFLHGGRMSQNEGGGRWQALIVTGDSQTTSNEQLERNATDYFNFNQKNNTEISFFIYFNVRSLYLPFGQHQAFKKKMMLLFLINKYSRSEHQQQQQ